MGNGRLGSLALNTTSRRMTGRGALDGVADPHIGAAAADVSRHRGVDVRIVRRGSSIEQRARRHDLPGLAVTALHDLEFEPCFLYHCACGCAAHRFDRGDRTRTDRTDWQY